MTSTAGRSEIIVRNNRRRTIVRGSFRPDAGGRLHRSINVGNVDPSLSAATHQERSRWQQDADQTCSIRTAHFL